MEKVTLRIYRPKDIVIVMILPYKKTGLYSFVNLTKGHICSCKFASLSEAFEDLERRITDGSIIKYERIDLGL